MASDENVEVVEKLLRRIVPGKETVFDVASDLDDDGVGNRLEVGMRDLPPLPIEPVIAGAKARDHVFHSLSHFGEYVSRESVGERCVVLADVDSRTIRAVLNEDDEWDRESIEFQAKTHPMFAPWEALIGKAIPVLEFALHVMQHRNAVAEPDGRELALMFSQIKASKSITKHVGVGPKSLNGVVIELQIGSEKSEVEVDLPESIAIDVPLFVDSDPVLMQLDLLVTEKREELVVFITAPELESARLKSFESMVAELRQQTGEIVGLGRVRHRKYETLDVQEASSRY